MSRYCLSRVKNSFPGIPKNNGMAIIEFTVVSLAMFILFFAIFEIGRFVYSVQMLNEATRRAARLAAVCYVTDKADIPSMDAVTSVLPGGYSSASVEIEYLDVNEAVVADPVTNFEQIRFVRARIDTNNTNYIFFNVFTLLSGSSLVPEFETTIPAESLGALRYASDPDTHTNCN